MPNRNSLIIVLIAVSLSGCYTRAYYVSPMYGKSSPYYTLPMQKDSISSAVYVNATLGALNTNHTTRDEVWDFQSSLYRTHNFKFFKVYYGIEGSAGNYHVARIDSFRQVPRYLDTATINRNAGNYFFGNIGLTNGFLFSVPATTNFEWRILGLQFSIQHELGNYSSFRNQLNPDSVSGLVTSKWLGSLSLSSGFCAQLKPVDFGMNFHSTWILGKPYSRTGHSTETDESHRYRYFTSLWYLTYKRTTYYLQSSFGDRLIGMQVGINYQLSTKK